jgi:predicted secreted hydrolase
MINTIWNESNTPEKWEDGIRTSGEKGTYEWWYFDAHLDDGDSNFLLSSWQVLIKPNATSYT